MTDQPERLPAEYKAEVAKTSVRPIILAEFFFETPVRFWTGLGDLVWDGKTWTGTGTLGQISSLEETVAVEATGASFVLSSIPSELISNIMATKFQNKAVIVYLGFLDTNWDLVEESTVDPIILFAGTMDVVSVIDGTSSATIKLNAENKLRDFSRPRHLRYTPSVLKAKYPTDKGLDYIVDLQDAVIDWGARV